MTEEAPKLNLTVYRYESYRKRLNKTKASGEIIDYSTGYKARLEVRDSVDALALAIDDGATVGATRIELGSTDPNIVIRINPTDTASLASGNYTYSLMVREEPATGDSQEIIVIGKLTVKEGVTQGVP